MSRSHGQLLPRGRAACSCQRWHGAFPRPGSPTLGSPPRIGSFAVYAAQRPERRLCTHSVEDKIGCDSGFRERVDDWGFSAVVLATGALRDRRLPVGAADEYVGKGLGLPRFRRQFHDAAGPKWGRGATQGGAPQCRCLPPAASLRGQPMVIPQGRGDLLSRGSGVQVLPGAPAFPASVLPASLRMGWEPRWTRPGLS